MYENGDGVPKDFKIAVKWYRLATEQGSTDAPYNLGMMYALGKGALKDYVYAQMWGSIAVSIVGKDYGGVLNIVEKNMTPSQLEKAQDLARECARKNYRGY